MKITLLGHSGFTVELNAVNLIFDYFTDAENVLARADFSAKPAVFFASHAHRDHFNRQIFRHAEPGRVFYMLGGGISSERRQDAVTLDKGQGAEALGVKARAYGSTDEGVSFMVHAEGRSLFHAGDLNDWYWEDESTKEELLHDERWFLDELAPLADSRPDIAFVPADARLGKHALRGPMHFVRTLRPARVALMHLSGGYALPGEFRQMLLGEGLSCEVLELVKPGDTITV